MKRMSVLVLLCTVSLGRSARAGEPVGPKVDRAKLDAEIKGTLKGLGDRAVAGVWLGGADGEARYAWEANAVRPAASSIKTAYLVALYMRFAELDRSPSGLDDALADDHPAMSPYTPAQRVEIRKALTGASVRTLGGVMMGSAPAPNAVYNAAASASTAVLGGPKSLTDAIHAIDPAFTPIVARRYMLTPRNVVGDNEATAASLAAVLARVASGKLDGLTPASIKAVRDTVAVRGDYLGIKGRHHLKDGALDSDPVTRVKSGWWEGPDGNVVYVVMFAQPVATGGTGARLEEAATRVTRKLLESAGAVTVAPTRP